MTPNTKGSFSIFSDTLCVYIHITLSFYANPIVNNYAYKLTGTISLVQVISYITLCVYIFFFLVLPVST
jgi:hypothetical protein